VHREGPRVGPRKAPESSPLQGARLHWQRGLRGEPGHGPRQGLRRRATARAPWYNGHVGRQGSATRRASTCGTSAGVDSDGDRYASCIEPPHVVE
jgi:hypothetical protein